MAYEFGQQAPDWATGVASILNPIASATSDIAKAKIQADLNEKRMKMGLPPLPETATISTEQQEQLPAAEESGSLKPILVVLAVAAVAFALYKMSNKQNG